MAKPQTKYFDGGYIQFRTREGQLFYRVVFSTKQTQFPFNQWTKVIDENYLKQLLAVKTRDELLTKVTEGQS